MPREKTVQKELWDFSQSPLPREGPHKWTLLDVLELAAPRSNAKGRTNSIKKKTKNLKTLQKVHTQKIHLRSLYLFKYVKAKRTFFWTVQYSPILEMQMK